MNSESEELKDIRHIRVCSSPDTYCGHPRQGGIWNFGGGEIAVAHIHAPCAYQSHADVRHDHGGYPSRAVVLLQRSIDGGETWPEENNVVIFDETLKWEERRDRLYGTQEQPPGILDMSKPESIFFWGRSYTGQAHSGAELAQTCFVLRSGDKGNTWEERPALVHNPFEHGRLIHRDNHPIVRMPDGTFLGALSAWPGRACLFGSDDDGLSWDYLSLIASDPSGLGGGRPTYAGLVLLPNGRLLCVTLNLSGQRNCIQINHSDDGGYSWSEPRPIVRWGDSPWKARRPVDASLPYSFHYRSPWPMLLDDGRLLVLFARRKPPFGMGCLFSEDQGGTWSREFIIRCDAAQEDLGYPVATQLEDGRIFTAYYYNVGEGNMQVGGARFIGGSFFRLP